MGKNGRRLFPFLGILLSILLTASGCTNSNSSKSDSDTGAPNESESTNSSSLAIPVDFPTFIPIHPGKIVVSTSTGGTNGRTWVVEVLVNDLESARLKVLSDLKQVNFVLQEESGIGTSEYLATLSNSDYSIRLKVYLEADTGEKEVMYIVTGK
jgi:hypothetical protein